MNPSSLTPREKVAETVLAYYRLLDTQPARAEELARWIDALPANHQAEALAMGLQHVLVLPAFKCYVLEQRGHSMRSFMRVHLTREELGYWVDDNDGGVRP